MARKLTSFINNEVTVSGSSGPGFGGEAQAAARVVGGSGDVATQFTDGAFLAMPDMVTGLMRFYGLLSVLTNKIRNSEGKVQNKVANLVAQIYRNRLRQGVGEKLAPLTEALTKPHKPLSTLADHVIVKEATFNGPAVVTFEKTYAKIAWLLENGYWMNIRDFPNVKYHLFEKAKAAAGASHILQILDRPGTSTLIWEVPARPHIHFLNDAVTKQVMRDVANNVTFGTPLSPTVSHLVNNAEAASRGVFKLIDTIGGL